MVAFWSILEGLRKTHVAYGFVHVRRRIRACGRGVDTAAQRAYIGSRVDAKAIMIASSNLLLGLGLPAILLAGALVAATWRWS